MMHDHAGFSSIFIIQYSLFFFGLLLQDMAASSPGYIILFDGVCNLCSGSVQFILKRDRQKKFLFGSLQGNTGQQYLKKYHLPANHFNSFILIEGEKMYTRSTAILRMCKHLVRGWTLMYGFIIIPRFIRDAFYNLVAKNGYRWFGKKEVCWLPTPELKSRFLD